MVLVWTKLSIREIQSKPIQTNEEKNMEKIDKNCIPSKTIRVILIMQDGPLPVINIYKWGYNPYE